MDHKLIAKDVLGVVRELFAIEFPTEDALKKYLKDHPGADKSKHKVKETQKDDAEKEAPAGKGKGEKEEAPAKKEAPAEKPDDSTSRVENYIKRRKEIFQKDSGISHDEYKKIEGKLDAVVEKSHDNYNKFEPLSDSSWKGYFKVGEDELLAAANGLVSEGHMTKEEVGHVLNRGLSEAKADVEAWKNGTSPLGVKKGAPNYDQYVQNANGHLKDWQSLIKKFKGGEGGKAPAEKTPEGEKPPEKPEGEKPEVEGKPDHPDLPLKTHSKAKVNAKTLTKVKNVMDANGLEGGEEELEELAGFKATLGQRVPEQDVGKYYVRNAEKLKKDFLANMDPSNYKDAAAFASAKKRIQKMPTGDFAKVLAAINSEDEEESAA